jgi:mono/diheme cytochrome c family protein
MTRVAVLFVVSMLVNTIFGSIASIATGEALESSPGWKDGAEVYAKVCGYCHDAGVGPALLGRQLPPPLLTAFARNGIRAMPAFRAAEIDDAALAKVAEYISKH